MKPHYFEQSQPDEDDIHLKMAIGQGYVPPKCLLGDIGGIALVESPLLVKRKLKRMCKSKKKRKIKKWLKNPKNYWMAPDPSFIWDKSKRMIICHPKIAEKIKKAIDQQGGQSCSTKRKLSTESCIGESIPMMSSNLILSRNYQRDMFLTGMS